MYKISLPDHRRRALKRLEENEVAYCSLKGKDNSYARRMKALQDLHRRVYEIYRDAPDEIEVGVVSKAMSDDLQRFDGIEACPDGAYVYHLEATQKIDRLTYQLTQALQYIDMHNEEMARQCRQRQDDLIDPPCDFVGTIDPCPTCSRLNRIDIKALQPKGGKG